MRDIVTDSRQKPKGKNLGNRQRYLRRIAPQVRGVVNTEIKQRKIKDAVTGREVSVPIKETDEPSFHHDPATGIKRIVLPGNKKNDGFVPGDAIPIPQGGSGSGSQGSNSDEKDMDEFQFILTRDEFLDMYFEDLELPDLIKVSLADLKNEKPHRAGFAKTGAVPNIDLRRTMRNATGRRLALGRPSEEMIEEAKAHIEALLALEDQRTAEDEEALIAWRETLAQLERIRIVVPWIDPIDVRFRRFEQKPMPATRAVMFCLMDVSASMTEPLKDLAKRFYMLLCLFLIRNYGLDSVELVFIRHTTEAQEVDEETFFTSKETGGTVMSSALKEASRIIKERYNPTDWNIYIAQASDGDNFSDDMPDTVRVLTEDLLPVVQYFAYIEVLGDSPIGFQGLTRTTAWKMYEPIQAERKNFRIKLVGSPKDIYPVFRELFEKRS